jgi:hypothetical protein
LLVLRLFRRRVVAVPTIFGWLLILMLLVAPSIAWFVSGETYLSATQRVPAEILVLEAWTQEEGANAAAEEFLSKRGQYRYIVVTGGYTGEPWTRRRWNQVEIATNELDRLGIPPDVVIAAPAIDPEVERTYEFAVAARHILRSRGIQPHAINVLTRSAHGRRTRLTFEKAFGPGVRVGIIAWIPPDYRLRAWWTSSERAADFLKESVGYAYELLFNSGRTFRHGNAQPEYRRHSSVRRGGEACANRIERLAGSLP